MNEDNLTNEYKKKWEQVTLSDSSRQKIADNLRAYTTMHPIVEMPAPQPSPFLSYFKLSYASAAALALVLLIGTATWRSEAGDSLYALKVGVGKTFGIDDFYETRLAMETQQSEDSVSAPEVAEETEDTPQPQNTLAMEAAPDTAYSALPVESSDATMSDSNTRIAMKESADAADMASDDSVSTMMLSQGAMDINLYRDDVARREKTYRALIEKYDAEFGADVQTELITKLNEALALYNEAEDKEEDAARLLLDSAMTSIGEVESTLSLLGEVTVEEGIVVDIKFTAETTQ